jgi:hypothetical protein
MIWEEFSMAVYISPTGNREVWDEGKQPEGHMTEEEWKALHPDPVPTKEEIQFSELENLDGSYEFQRRQLAEDFANAMLADDTELQQELKAQLQALNEEYDQKREAILNGN